MTLSACCASAVLLLSLPVPFLQLGIGKRNEYGRAHSSNRGGPAAAISFGKFKRWAQRLPHHSWQLDVPTSSNGANKAAIAQAQKIIDAAQ